MSQDAKTTFSIPSFFSSPISKVRKRNVTMTRKRRRTPSLRPSGLDQLPFLLVMVTLWSWSSVTAAVTASSSFPGRLPTQPQAPPVWYSDGGGSDSDEELESSSDFEEIPLDEGPATTRPMQTLQKLQQLLDETDYRTTTVQKASNPTKTKGTPEVPASAETVLKPSSTTVFSQNETQTPTRVHNATFVPQFSTPYPTKELWTSKDRNRYKRQQYLQRQEAIWSEESDEGDHSDGLSQLPVYMSDDENELDEAKLQKPAPPQKRPQAVERSTQSSRNQPSLSFGHGSTFYQDRMAYPYHQPSELYRGPPPLVNYGVHMPPPWMPRAPPPPPGYYANSGYYSQQSHHHLQHQSPSNIPPLRATAETARNQPPLAATTTAMSVLSTPITSAPPAYQVCSIPKSLTYIMNSDNAHPFFRLGSRRFPQCRACPLALSRRLAFYSSERHWLHMLLFHLARYLSQSIISNFMRTWAT